MSETIAILNQKGGVGKTTTTINLGRFLAKAGKSVLIVDLDPQANTTSGLGVNKTTLESSIYDVIVDNVEASKVIRELSEFELWLLPAQPDLAGAEIELASQEERETRLKKALSNLDFDYILIDCPPSLGLLSVNALTAADSVIIPVQTEYYALEGVSQLVDIIQRVRQSLNSQLKLLGIVLTMYDSRTSLSQQVESEVRKFFKDSVFDTVIPRNVRLAEAPSYGKPAVDYDKWSKGTRAYKQLAKEVIKRG